MKIGSLFDGIGGWPLAAEKVGFVPVWSSEIEVFPIEVTEKHFPQMKQLGDLTKINGAEVEPVDIITFGSPCQDLSIAGKRGGLKGARSGLFGEAIRIIREMQRATEGKYPRFAIWENVPGTFSSNKGLDFRTVLEEITEAKIPMPRSKRWATAGMVRSDKCEVAWRVLDAQYWGVPQRRKRIFLVADFGGRCAGEILFKPESVSRYFAEGCSERKSVAGNVANSVRATSDRNITFTKISSTLRAGAGAPKHFQDYTGRLRVHINNVCPTLNTAQGGQRQPRIAYCIAGNTIDRKIENSGNGKGVKEEVSFTLNTIDRHAVAFPSISYSEFTNSNKASTLKACGGVLGGGSENLAVAKNQHNYKVCRLTPTECERLQGLPENWTAGGSDTARYKALGNGMAQPCADYVMQGLWKWGGNK